MPDRTENGAPGGSRTPDQLLRRQLLYPLSYEGAGACTSLTGYREQATFVYAPVRVHYSDSHGAPPYRALSSDFVHHVRASPAMPG